MEDHWKFLGGGGGVLKAKFLEAICENKLEFPGGGSGVQNKKPSVGGVWIFCGTAHLWFNFYFLCFCVWHFIRYMIMRMKQRKLKIIELRIKLNHNINAELKES